MSGGFEAVREIGRRIHLLTHINALLGWDQEVYMPDGAIAERAEQLSYIEGLVYDETTSKDLGSALRELGASEEAPRGKKGLGDIESAHVRILFNMYRKQTKLPKQLVMETAKETSIAQNKWVEARKKKDYKLFEPHLARLLELTAEKIEKLGWKEHPYDVLLDDFEPGATTATVTPVFARLREGLKDLVQQIGAAEQVDAGFVTRRYDRTKQEQFGRNVLEAIGYDFNRGRLDISAHPFTTTLGADDVRITTRYNENFFNTGIFGIIHEAGHALYELGFSDEIRGGILADGTSLGIHESQSRMWENMIGRGFSFWKRYYAKLQSLFPEPLQDISLEQFYRGINKVEPSFIRVEADEVTYNLHIILRFELELALITGELSPANLPDAWNSKFADFFGITPPNDAEGVLQDIHWSMGAYGYFPTYALGNLYSAQFFTAMKKAMPDIEEKIEAGTFTEILRWLREHIHASGSIYTAGEVCRNISGSDLDPGYFLKYIDKKFGAVYGLSGR
jgi:carboxypeptidase Taq